MDTFQFLDIPSPPFSSALYIDNDIEFTADRKYENSRRVPYLWLGSVCFSVLPSLHTESAYFPISKGQSVCCSTDITDVAPTQQSISDYTNSNTNTNSNTSQGWQLAILLLFTGLSLFHNFCLHNGVVHSIYKRQ